MVWFHGGKHEIEDATPECIAARTLTETIGLKVRETNLRHLGTQSSERVYCARSTRIDTERYINLSGSICYMKGINFGAASGVI
jgi:hypothetical protein